MSQQLTKIFHGVNPQHSRDSIATYLKDGPWNVYVQPFAGRFALVEAMAQATGKPERIWASDVSLFSSLIGYYLTGRNLKELGLEITEPRLKEARAFLNNGPEHVAAGLLAIKYAQLSGRKAYYYQAGLKEITRNLQTYIDDIAGQIEIMAQSMKGIHYRVLDYRDELKEHVDNPEAFIVCDPPKLKGDYAKMFDPKTVFTWEEPEFEWFDPSEFEDLLKDYQDVEATVLLLQFKRAPVKKGWNVVASFDKRTGHNDTTWRLLANKVLPAFTYSSYHKRVKAKYNIFNDQVVTRKTKILTLAVDKRTADYYRDLLVHKLGAAGGEAFFLILLDGKVACVVGVNLNHFTRRGLNYLFLNYTIKATNPKEPKLSNLLYRIIYSRAFKEELIAQTKALWNSLQFRDFNKVRSTNITPVPDIRFEFRGTKLIDREFLPEGKYHNIGANLWKVVYEHDITNKTYKQVVAEYVQYREKLKRTGVL